MTAEHQERINQIIGKRVKIKKGHPHAGEKGTITEFHQRVGILGKPGFVVKGDNGDEFFVFNGNELMYL